MQLTPALWAAASLLLLGSPSSSVAVLLTPSASRFSAELQAAYGSLDNEASFAQAADSFGKKGKKDKSKNGKKGAGEVAHQVPAAAGAEGGEHKEGEEAGEAAATAASPSGAETPGSAGPAGDKGGPSEVPPNLPPKAAEVLGAGPEHEGQRHKKKGAVGGSGAVPAPTTPGKGTKKEGGKKGKSFLEFSRVRNWWHEKRGRLRSGGFGKKKKVSEEDEDLDPEKVPSKARRFLGIGGGSSKKKKAHSEEEEPLI